MKLNRRNFLLVSAAGAAGGAVGSMFSPLSWKLMDDSSIWTQAWPWTPVPLDGEVSFDQTTCTLCPGGCGIQVRKVNGRPVKIEGVEGHAVNSGGGVCILGLSGLQLVYGPARIRTPLKRTGQRGQGKWVEITWDEAIAEVSRKLGGLREHGKAHTLGCITGAGRNTVSGLFARFMEAYGSPNLYYQATAWDSYEAAIRLMHGVDGQAAFDLEKSDFILSFGAGLLDGWGAPVRAFQAYSAWRDNNDGKVTVVQVEPHMSNTAAKADKWLPIKPGTEGALAMGMANVIIRESLYDQGFVNWYTEGFDDSAGRFGRRVKGFRRIALEDYPLPKVSEITGVSEENIQLIARAFARAKKPLALCGKGAGGRPMPLAEVMAVHALNALVGSVNREEGGVYALPRDPGFAWGPVAQDRMSRMGARGLLVEDPGTGMGAANLLSSLPEALKANKDGLHALLVAGANPFYSLPNAEEAAKALEGVEFIVSFASQMDETFAFSDIILPDHTHLEGMRDVPTPPGFGKPFTGLAKAVLEPVYKTRHAGDSILAIAQAMGGAVAESFPWGSYEEALQEAMGDRWDTMNSDGAWVDEAFAVEPPASAFQTPSRRFEFCPVARHRNGLIQVMPGLDPKTAISGDAAKYPLILTPCDSIRVAAGAVAGTPFMVKTVADTVLKENDLVVTVNTQTARQFGLQEGKKARLTTPAGSATVRVHCSEEIAPGLIGAPTGLGHTAYDVFVGGKGANYNALVTPVHDPVTGLDVASGVRAKLV